MKVLKSLFLALALTILGYSAVEAGAQDLIADDTVAVARKCCNYQADCPADHTCKTISPTCSANLPNICVKNTVTATPIGGGLVPEETPDK
jgi:hypothetical protein